MRHFSDDGEHEAYIPDHAALGLPDPDLLPQTGDEHAYEDESVQRLCLEEFRKAEEESRRRNARVEALHRKLRARFQECVSVTPKRIFRVLDELDQSEDEEVRAHAQEFRHLASRLVQGPLASRQQAWTFLCRRLRDSSPDSWPKRDRDAFERLQLRVTHYDVE